MHVCIHIYIYIYACALVDACFEVDVHGVKCIASWKGTETGGGEGVKGQREEGKWGGERHRETERQRDREIDREREIRRKYPLYLTFAALNQCISRGFVNSTAACEPKSSTAIRRPSTNNVRVKFDVDACICDVCTYIETHVHGFWVFKFKLVQAHSFCMHTPNTHKYSHTHTHTHTHTRKGI